MNQYMLMFSLGPIQSFIAQARKTRDLWLGSHILSTLMEAAMAGIEERVEEFVFPTQGNFEGNPNKYIALFKTSTDAQEAAKISKQKLIDRWETICQSVWNEIVQDYADPETEKIWKRQTNADRFFEIFWVIVDGDPDKYKEWLNRSQMALDARKRLRDFLPQDEPEIGEKSTISGEREALRGTDTSREKVRKFWVQLTEKLSPKDISNDGSERLDAIDMVKRFATVTNIPSIPKQPFPSTSSIATASFVNRLLTEIEMVDASVLTKWHNITRGNLALAEDAPEAIPYLRERAGEHSWILRRDGDSYFPETFTQKYLTTEYRFPDNDETKLQASECRKALKALLEATDKLSIPRPTPYYAIVQMDGDHMGTILSKVQGSQQHKDISTALSEFAREDALKLVQNNHPGRVVYAGGDDVLAFTPLEGLLNMAYLLQEHYCDRVKKPVAPEYQHEVTASMGIAIAHHFTPLSFVLRAVRDAESLAKKRYGRNSLVICVIRRSGEQTWVGCRWQYAGLEENAAPIKPIPLFSRFRELFETDVLSPKCVHNLLDEAPTLVWLNRQAQASEIKRVLKRQRSDIKKSELPDTEIEQRAKELSELAAAMDITHKNEQKSTELRDERLRYGLIETLGWLLVMAFLARKEQD